MLLRIFLPFALGYYTSFLFRVVNTVVFRDLVAELALPATALGLLTAAYFLSFAACQIPLGLALDRFGPRRVSAGLMGVAGLGSLGFALSNNTEQLLLSRALIGVGCSGALMAAITAFRVTFTLERLPKLNGWLLACGGIGAMSATAPVELAMAAFGWRGVFVLLAASSVSIGLLTVWLVPDQPRQSQPESVGQLLQGLAAVVRDSSFWAVALIFVCGSGATLALQTLWVAPWLRDVMGMERSTAALVLLGMNFAFVCGSISLGQLADRWVGRGIGAPQLMIIAVLLQATALGVISFGASPIAIPAWLAFHLCASIATLGYAILGRRFARELTGRSATSANLCAFVGAFAFQFAVGAILDAYPATAEGYDPRGYTVALLSIAALQVAAVFVFWLRTRHWGIDGADVIPAAAGERSP